MRKFIAVALATSFLMSFTLPVFAFSPKTYTYAWNQGEFSVGGQIWDTSGDRSAPVAGDSLQFQVFDSAYDVVSPAPDGCYLEATAALMVNGTVLVDGVKPILENVTPYGEFDQDITAVPGDYSVRIYGDIKCNSATATATTPFDFSKPLFTVLPSIGPKKYYVTSVKQVGPFGVSTNSNQTGNFKVSILDPSHVVDQLKINYGPNNVLNPSLFLIWTVLRPKSGNSWVRTPSGWNATIALQMSAITPVQAANLPGVYLENMDFIAHDDHLYQPFNTTGEDQDSWFNIKCAKK